MSDFRKGISPLISYVLLTGVIIAATTSILAMGYPLLNEMRDTTSIQQAINTLNEVDSAIRDTASGGTYTTRTFRIMHKRGDYFFDEDNNAIVYEIDTESTIISPHTSTDLGPITLSSNTGVGASIDDENSCYLLENDVTEVCISQSEFDDGESDTSDLIVYWDNKDISEEVFGGFEVFVNNDESTSSGEIQTRLSEKDGDLPRGTVEAEVRNAGPNDLEYTVTFELYPDSDFVKVDVSGT